MKTLLILAALVAVTCANNVHLPKSEQEMFQLSVECMVQSGVKFEVLVESIDQKKFKDDEGLKKFVLCFFQKSGIMDRDGRLNVDATLSTLPESADKAGVKKVLEKCNSKKGRDTADTAYEVFKCVLNKKITFLHA